MCGNTDLWKELRGVLGVSRETDARDQLALHPLLPLFCRGPIISEEWRKMGLLWGGQSWDAQSWVGIRQRKCMVSLALNEEQRSQEAERGGEAILDALLI